MLGCSLSTRARNSIARQMLVFSAPTALSSVFHLSMKIYIKRKRWFDQVDPVC
jgi:hypothetical protein